jgi:hypothetical protein
LRQTLILPQKSPQTMGFEAKPRGGVFRTYPQK